MNIIDSRWIKDSSYTATNAYSEVLNTIGGRILGEGIFYFELTTPASGRMINRWIGFVSVNGTNYNHANSCQILWQPQLNTVYGIEIDLTSPSTPKYRYHIDGGSFSSLIDIKGSNGVPLSIIKPAIGSADGSNNAIPFTINAGQEPFAYPYKAPNLYSFDGKQRMHYDNKTLILNDGEYKKWNEEIPAIDDSVNAIPIMTSDITPKGVASSSGFRSGFPPYHAFDNNSSTLWRLDLDPVNYDCWLMYEFEKPKIIERIEFGSFNLSGGNHGVKNFEILGSNDGMSFTNLYTGVHPNNANLVRYSFVNNEKFKMYKLKVISSYTGYTAVATLNMYEQKADRIFGHWTVESTTLPNSIKFFEEGMDNLSPLLDRTVTELESMSMADKSEILDVGEVGKVFSGTIDLKKYFDIRSIKVEVK